MQRKSLETKLESLFGWRKKSIGDPGKYLGGKLRKVELNNGIDCWAFISTQYVQYAVNNVEQYLKVKVKKLLTKAPAPFQNNYRPDIYMTEELGKDDAAYYHF